MTKEMQKTKTIGFISLGCDKNRVDLEKMMASLKDSGFILTEDINLANIILINTCAFILPAREESIQNILSVIKSKGNGTLEKIVVCGCLPQKNFDEVKSSLPEVDLFVKVAQDPEIATLVKSLYDGEEELEIKPKYCATNRVLSTAGHYAYLKIADGCDNCCSYCTIPRIRGRYRSVEIDELLKEAKSLASNGVQELIIVAQDTTRYGEDIYGENKLCELLEKLSKVKGIELIRLHYCYPEKITDELLNLISANDKICKYLDIPLQHISQTILKSMNRRTSEQDIYDLIEKIHSQTERIAIRSTFIVGYPGETRADFNKLLMFLQKEKLDNVGFFAYSREENTKAFYLPKQKFNFVKKLRLKKAQNVQEKIANNICNSKLGQTTRVLIDEFDEQTNNYYGHDQFNSPNVDFVIAIQTDKAIQIGSFVNVKLVEFNGYEFKGEIYESTK